MSTAIPSLYDFKLSTLEGEPLPLSRFQGQVVLLVNVASRCGLTPQYAGLEQLYRQYQAQGLVVLGVPCNQFAAQEPGTAEDIRAFCQLNYGVSFPLTQKLSVNGPERHPLYLWLAGEQAKFPGDITWNFEKFLLGRDGQVRARFSPRIAPEDPLLVQALGDALAS